MKLASRKLEALLLLGEEPMTRKELRRRLEIDEAALRDCIREIQEYLHDHGIMIVEAGDEVTLATSPDLADWLKVFFSKNEPVLSKAASETLAIILYSGPITRFEIESIRGVDCRSMLRLLRQRGLIVREKSREQAVRYDVSTQTLRELGVGRKTDLPRYKELAHHAVLKHLSHPLN